MEKIGNYDIFYYKVEINKFFQKFLKKLFDKIIKIWYYDIVQMKGIEEV